MEATNKFTELEEMRSQLNILKQKLETQKIVNDKLMRETMKKKMSWIGNYANIQAFVLYPIIIIIFLVLKIETGISWGPIIFVYILTGIDILLDIKINKMQESDWESSNLIATKLKLMKMKKYRMRQVITSIPFLLVWVVWISFELMNSTLDKGLVIAGIIGGVIGGIVGGFIGFKILFKQQRTNDEIIRMIEEIESGE